MYYFQLILTITALLGRKADILVLVFINEGPEGPRHFTDRRQSPRYPCSGGTCELSPSDLPALEKTAGEGVPLFIAPVH